MNIFDEKKNIEETWRENKWFANDIIIEYIDINDELLERDIYNRRPSMENVHTSRYCFESTLSSMISVGSSLFFFLFFFNSIYISSPSLFCICRSKKGNFKYRSFPSIIYAENKMIVLWVDDKFDESSLILFLLYSL